MGKLLLVLRTLRYVKPIQIWNRIWRKFLPKGVSDYESPTESLGEFEFLNVKGIPKGWNDSRFEKLWLYNLHYFDYLATMGDKECEEIIEKWIRDNPVGYGNGWDPYPISLRVVNWVKYFTRRGRSPRPTERESLEAQVRWLRSRLEYHLLANHLLANAKALVFAGKFLGNEKWYNNGLAIYKKELPEQTCSDGVNFELSPMYHCIILEDVLDCFELTGDVLFKEYAEKMLGGLKLVLGPDGKISKFNDSTEGIALSPDQLLAYAKDLGVESASEPVREALTIRCSGYVRMEKGAYCVIAKCGDIGPSYQPGHAHADTFTFEMWKDGRKIVGDTGCSTYVPGPIRSYERSTAAHNTVVIDGRNSSEVWAAHRVGRRFDKRTHQRKFVLEESGLRVVDSLGGSGVHDVEVRFHLPPGVSESDMEIDCSGERCVEPCDFATGWNKREAGTCVIYRNRLTLPAKIEWSLK